jgi:hypothetical protein
VLIGKPVLKGKMASVKIVLQKLSQAGSKADLKKM